VQVLYEALRAESLAEGVVQSVDARYRDQWERVGVLGLFSSEDSRGGTPDTTHWIQLQQATDMSQAGPRLVEAYRILIERSLNDRFPRRRSHASPSSRDLREGVVSSSA
jgi:hypothetical protein